MATATAPNVTNLPVDQIDPSPDNPRTAFGGDLGERRRGTVHGHVRRELRA